MSERYSRLFSLEDNLYIEGSPVIISAGALLKDSENNELIGQIKFINISSKIIKGLSVVLELKDSANRATGERVDHMYLDLNVKRNDTFGSKTPIKISNKLVRGFKAKVTEVIYKDNSVWKCELSEEWEAIPKQVSLKGFLGNEELLEQYTLDFNSRAEFKYLEYRDLWLCCCGGVNNKTEDRCASCGAPVKVSENINVYDLNESLKKRKAKERELREAEEKERTLILQKQKEVKEKRNKILIVSCIGTAILITVLIILYFTVIKPNAEKKNKYEEANSLYDHQNYAAAEEKYEELGNYKDANEKSKVSKEKAQEETDTKLQEVKKLIGIKNYYDAAILLEDYELTESENDLYNECMYNTILDFMKGNLMTNYDLSDVDRFAEKLKASEYKNFESLYEKMYDWSFAVQDHRYTVVRGPKKGTLSVAFYAYDDNGTVLQDGVLKGLRRLDSGVFSFRPKHVKFVEIGTGRTWDIMEDWYQ